MYERVRNPNLSPRSQRSRLVFEKILKGDYILPATKFFGFHHGDEQISRSIFFFLLFRLVNTYTCLVLIAKTVFLLILIIKYSYFNNNLQNNRLLFLLHDIVFIVLRRRIIGKNGIRRRNYSGKRNRKIVSGAVIRNVRFKMSSTVCGKLRHDRSAFSRCGSGVRGRIKNVKVYLPKALCRLSNSNSLFVFSGVGGGNDVTRD